MLYKGLYGKVIKKPLLYCTLHCGYVDKHGLKRKKSRCNKCRYSRALTFNEICGNYERKGTKQKQYGNIG